MARAPGKVYLVGAGPGAPDLLTLRAADVLKRADIVFHDALVHPDVLAVAARARKIAVGKRCGRHATAQQFINKRLVDAAREHPVVVRLKGGDPMLFGRAQEEIAALEAAGVQYEIIPGVTAALLAAGAPRDLPVLVMENATLPQSRRVALTLAELPLISGYGFEGPTVIMLGAIFAPALARSAARGALPDARTA